jgi:predicted TIM-barrel fold metal-dependent hydrolase
MNIVDAHMHLGEDLIFLVNDTEEQLLSAMDANGVETLMLQPGIVTPNQRKAHERIRDFALAHPGRVYGIACFSPYLEEGEYSRLVRWTVKELGFKGVKMHPYAFCHSPGHPAAEKIFRAAAEFDIPVMIHTGNGVPNALPSLCLPAARKHPDLKIILAHAGGGMYAAEATIVAQECPNVYLETSWVPIYELQAMVNKLGPERILFGSDLANNIPVELAKYRSLGLSEDALGWCLGKTARKLFKLDS